MKEQLQQLINEWTRGLNIWNTIWIDKSTVIIVATKNGTSFDVLRFFQFGADGQWTVSKDAENINLASVLDIIQNECECNQPFSLND